MTAAPKLLTLTCSECEREFTASRRDAKTCSDNCRQARRQRRKTEISEMLIAKGQLDPGQAEDKTANAFAALRFLRRKYPDEV